VSKRPSYNSLWKRRVTILRTVYCICKDLLCDHFKALELAVFGVKLEEAVNIIFGDKEINSAVVFFIMFLSHHLFELIFEGIGVKINMRKMRTISDKVFELSVMCHFSIVNIWEVSLF